MLKGKDKIYAQIIKNCSMTKIIPVIGQQVGKKPVVDTDDFKTYNNPAGYSCKKHSGKKRKFWIRCKADLTGLIYISINLMIILKNVNFGIQKPE